MKKILVLGCSLIAAALFLQACGSESTNVSVNHPANNTGTSTVNSVTNSVSNAVNSVSNAVSRATTDDPDDFMTAAAQGGMAEIEMGKLASTKAQNPEVKKFGQMMVTDHTAVGNDLKALAAKKNFKLPADVGSHKSDIDDLAKLSGADFDKEYVKEMVDDHETDVSEFEKQAANSPDADVKAFAAKSLPILKKHLDAIKAIQAKMDK